MNIGTTHTLCKTIDGSIKTEIRITDDDNFYFYASMSDDCDGLDVAVGDKNTDEEISVILSKKRMHSFCKDMIEYLENEGKFV